MATEVAFAKTFLAVLDTKPTKISPDHVEDARTYPASTPFTLPAHPTIRPFRKVSRAPAAPGSTPASASASTTSPSPSGTATPSAAGSGPTAVVHIRSPRNPSLSLTLPSPQPLATTSILDIKTSVSLETGMPVEKLKVLYNKKPAGDVKSLKEVLGGTVPEGGELELALMVMGGQATYDSDDAKAARAAREASKAATEGGEDKKEETVPEVEMKDSPAAQATGTKTTAGGEAAGPVAQGLSGVAVLDTEEFWEDLKGYLQQRIRDVDAAEEVVGKFRGAWSGK